MPNPNPKTIHLGGPVEFITDWTASEAISPGMQVELFSTGGALKWRKVVNATSLSGCFIALDFPDMNKGVTDAYAANDQVRVGAYSPGGRFMGVVASGQDITIGEELQPGGGGTFITASVPTAAGNVARFIALTELGAIVANTFCRMLVKAA
jgi:hypothetical protein